MVDRRKFLKLSAIGGGAVFMSGLYGHAPAADAASATAAVDDFYFVQLSDCHWGYSGAANPDAANTLKKAVATVNALDTKPDFIIFTGDLTHTTDDAAERRKRMTEFTAIVKDLPPFDQKTLGALTASDYQALHLYKALAFHRIR